MSFKVCLFRTLPEIWVEPLIELPYINIAIYHIFIEAATTVALRQVRGTLHLLLISKQNENEIANEMPPKPPKSMQNFCYCRQINFANATGVGGSGYGGGAGGVAGPTNTQIQENKGKGAKNNKRLAKSSTDSKIMWRQMRRVAWGKTACNWILGGGGGGGVGVARWLFRPQLSIFPTLRCGCRRAEIYAAVWNFTRQVEK